MCVWACIHPSICVSVCLSACLPVCLSVCLLFSCCPVPRLLCTSHKFKCDVGAALNMSSSSCCHSRSSCCHSSSSCCHSSSGCCHSSSSDNNNNKRVGSLEGGVRIACLEEARRGLREARLSQLSLTSLCSSALLCLLGIRALDLSDNELADIEGVQILVSTGGRGVREGDKQTAMFVCICARASACMGHTRAWV